MSAENTQAENVDTQAATDEAATIVSTVEKAVDSIAGFGDRLEQLEEKVEKASEVQYPYGQPGSGAHAVRKGESVLSSRPWSLMRAAIALKKRSLNEGGWDANAKVEMDLSERLAKEYNQHQKFAASGFLAPLASDLMPTGETHLTDGTVLPGLPVELVKECRDTMRASMGGLDWDEYEMLAKRGVISVQKDLSANVATTGGTLRGFAAQGELIELLRAQEVMSMVGAQEIDLPPQGAIRFPRVTSGVTINAYSEGATVTESTPGTGALELAAKAYSGLVDIPDELMRFATSVAVEAWLRQEFIRDLSLKTTQDMINGAGGTSIQGLVNYSGLRTVTATTTGANGDTLEAEDPIRLYADIADQNAPVDRGFFYAATNTLLAGLMTRQDSQGAFIFNIAANSLGGGAVQQTLNGHRLMGSTQVPTDRTKGASSNLTMLLGGVGADYVIARSGVVEITMTNSDASKFQQRISTMRGTSYMDAGPRHEESFGIIDDITNS